MRQTTSLKTKVYDTALEWNIDNFIEYPESNVKELTSERVGITGFNSSWELTVFPRFQTTECVALRFKIYGDLESVGHQTLVKFEVRAEGDESVEPAVWNVDYSPIRDRQEFSCEKFIERDKLDQYLSGETLALYVKCNVKTVEVVNVFKK